LRVDQSHIPVKSGRFRARDALSMQRATRMIMPGKKGAMMILMLDAHDPLAQDAEIM
jgi:hypothetical protein